MSKSGQSILRGARQALAHAGGARRDVVAERAARPSQKATTRPLTISFADFTRARARDPAFRTALFNEAMHQLATGDLEETMLALRVYIKATIGFEKLAEATGTPVKSLMRMVGPKGNPQAKHLLAIVAILQKRTGVKVEVKVGRRAP
jgi:DNA-binding phage protein